MFLWTQTPKNHFKRLKTSTFDAEQHRWKHLPATSLGPFAFLFSISGVYGAAVCSLGVCRPETGLHLLWLQKFRSLFPCSYSEELLLAHCYSGRVTDRHTQNGSMSASATATSCSSWRGCNAGGGRDVAILSLSLSLSAVMRRGAGRHQISDPDSWEKERQSVREGAWKREREPCEKGVEERGDLVRCWMEQPPTNYQRGKVV